MNKEEDKHISLDLKVRKSDIQRVGLVRISDKTISKLEIEEGDRVIITKDDVSILRMAYGDSGLKNDEIFIRPTGRKQLNIKDGDIVKVEDYETIGEDIKERLGDIGDKIGESVDKLKDRFKREEGEDKKKK